MSKRWMTGLVAVFTGLAAGPLPASLTPGELRCEYLESPLGLDDRYPRLSWKLSSTERGASQTAYQIQVTDDRALFGSDEANRWDSGRVESDRTVAVRYSGTKLSTREQLWWRVRVWDEKGAPSAWSAVARWEMGLLEVEDWHAKWIARAPFPGIGRKADDTLPLFRKAFHLTRPIKRARLHVVGLGYHEVTLNGERVGDHLLDPGFTRYDRRVLAVTHDVTTALRGGGENVIGVMLGNGWFNVETLAVWMFDEAPWRASPRLLLQLEIDYGDGTTEMILSDETWSTASGPILESSIYGGEVHDARREQAGWDRPGFDDQGWRAAWVVDAPHGRIASQAMHPIRVEQTLRPVAVHEVEPGVWVYDFGQNLVGNAELVLTAPEGTTVSLRYGETIREDGRVDQEAIGRYIHQRGADQRVQTDVYTCKGGGEERWSSRFTYHGFRYVEVTGAPAGMGTGNLTARFFHTDVPATGAFSCSDPTLNQLWANGRWSYLGNLMSIPTDCPHREKNGWTGDAHIACEQGLFYQDGITFYEKWLDDLTDEQFIDGGLPGIVPTSGQWGYERYRGPAWDSALVLIPWYLYLYYGDDTALRANYDSFTRYVGFLNARARDGIIDIGLPDWSPWRTKTPTAITDTAYYYRNVQLCAMVAEWLGRTKDAARYERMAGEIKTAFNREFFDPQAGTYGNDSQTSLGAALHFDLVPAEQRSRVMARLEHRIHENEDHLDFGHLGSKYVFGALANGGRADLAHRMITQPTPPSYAWQIAQGATTMWERWEPTFSLNHTFFGDVNAWMMKHLAGIRADPEAPGFARVLIAPQPVGELTYAEGEYQSIRGRIATRWTRGANHFSLRVSIPANTTALVTLPVPSTASVSEEGIPLESVQGITRVEPFAGGIAIELGSGEYQFEARWDESRRTDSVKDAVRNLPR